MKELDKNTANFVNHVDYVFDQLAGLKLSKKVRNQLVADVSSLINDALNCAKGEEDLLNFNTELRQWLTFKMLGAQDRS